MEYLLVYYDDPSSGTLQDDERQEAYRKECDTWQEGMTRDGILVRTVGLTPAEEATTVRVRDGRSLVADGPFAETREQMGGVSLIECRDLDQAREVAASHPWSAIGLVEIRPVLAS